MKKLLNTVEVAAMTGLSKSTLEKRRLSGQPPKFIKLGTKRVAYDPADIAQWIEQQRRRSTSDDGQEFSQAVKQAPSPVSTDQKE